MFTVQDCGLQKDHSKGFRQKRDQRGFSCSVAITNKGSTRNLPWVIVDVKLIWISIAYNKDMFMGVPISVETSEYMATVENEKHSLVQLLLMYQALKKLNILHVTRGDELADYHSPKSTGWGDRPDSHPLKT
ncbi:solute carrier family 22 member 5 [Platysternon megacephalum]|uniref:Solute carrier family 22 member 5 n=1 Tax=Platysternon megacephalum TaxID=55544 RepID=A0A4D9EWH8_9SAUR|nr:solute carrier family 22 member 5 [Platysternon megacephalum]